MKLLWQRLTVILLLLAQAHTWAFVFGDGKIAYKENFSLTVHAIKENRPGSSIRTGEKRLHGYETALEHTYRYVYDAFGNTLLKSGVTVNPYQFTGERFDEDLGMYYLRARYMNAETGRFWTLDSYEGRMGDPISLHKYLYANGCPVMWVDPSGKSPLGEVSMGSIIMAGVMGGVTQSIISYMKGERNQYLFIAFVRGFVLGALTRATGGLATGSAGMPNPFITRAFIGGIGQLISVFLTKWVEYALYLRFTNEKMAEEQFKKDFAQQMILGLAGGVFNWGIFNFDANTSFGIVFVNGLYSIADKIYTGIDFMMHEGQKYKENKDKIPEI